MKSSKRDPHLHRSLPNLMPTQSSEKRAPKNPQSPRSQRKRQLQRRLTRQPRKRSQTKSRTEDQHLQSLSRVQMNRSGRSPAALGSSESNIPLSHPSHLNRLRRHRKRHQKRRQRKHQNRRKQRKKCLRKSLRALQRHQAAASQSQRPNQNLKPRNKSQRQIGNLKLPASPH